MIRVEGLTKTFTANKEKVAAVDGIDFEVGAGEMVTLLGPSGCGKTTTLRCVAGLEKAESGRIVIGNQTMVDVAAGVFVPPMVMRPVVFCSRPAIMRSVVVLPQPDGPSSVRNSPASTFRLTRSTARAGPKARLTFSSKTAVIGSLSDHG